MNEVQLRQALQVAQSNFQGEHELRLQAEAALERVVAEVIAMAFLLLGPDLAERTSQGQGSLRDVPPVEMVRHVKMRAYERLLEAERATRVEVIEVAGKRIACLEARVRELETENAALRGQLADAQRVGRVQLEMDGLKQQDETESQARPAGDVAIPTASPATVDADLLHVAQTLLKEDPPDEKVQALVAILAGGQECRRREVDAQLAMRLSVSPGGGTTHRAFKRAAELGLVESTSPKTEARGRASDLLRLTPLGLAVAKMLGYNPIEPLLDRLLACHKSPEHALLNLEAADLLRAAGGTVDLFPQPVRLSNGGTLDVDLLWSANGSARYVECERETFKNDSQRRKKWHNLAQVTSDFWIVVPNPSAQQALQSEVTLWAFEGRYTLHLHLTNLTEATPEKPWLYERPIKFGR